MGVTVTSILSFCAQFELVTASGTDRSPRVPGGDCGTLPGVCVTVRTTLRYLTSTAATLALHVPILVPARPLASGHLDVESEMEHETVESEGRLKSVRFTDVPSMAHAVICGGHVLWNRLKN